MPTVTVEQGDCVSSIAAVGGLTWERVWNHPNNASLRKLRKDPNVLYPGDEIFVPEKENRIEDRPADAKHQFQLNGAMAKINLRLLDGDTPRANLPYELEVDGKTVKSGSTDGSGELSTAISPIAREAKLYVGDGPNRDVYILRLGSLDPIDQDEGVSGRLLCLGYGIDDIAEAIKAFQQKKGLPVTGSADDQTRQKLQEAFGQ